MRKPLTMVEVNDSSHHLFNDYVGINELTVLIVCQFTDLFITYQIVCIKFEFRNQAVRVSDFSS